LKAIYLPAFFGVGLEILIELIYLSIISIIFLNKFMFYYFFKSDCNTNDQVCLSSNIWDRLNKTSYPNDQIQKMRFSVMIIQCGIYLIIKAIKLMNLKEPNNMIENKKESYDKNIWKVKTWYQGNFLWIWVLFICFE
jgi:hypothetical protein